MANQQPPTLPDDLLERLGEMVRDVWVEWAKRQPDPKESWLIPWAQLDSAQREVDVLIGRALYMAGYEDGLRDGLA
ncbi:hypothetical protein AB0B89_36600 [Sphaerisporangium sp. NPDC049002]|uniref:hypothetical protein n=1 Tax=Sphaerisporangium sp. NPDC049002 TaxID=3155392 RepID=UPI0033CBE9B8